MQKVAIMGVHSAGKTSLAYILSAHFKMKGLNVKLLHESVRENCPFPINADANEGTCLWNFHKQFLNELEAEAQGYQLAICDRSVLDTFVYFHAVNPDNAITRSAEEQASQWLTTYDLLICLEPTGEVELLDDGVRSVDRDYQELICNGFKKVLGEHGQALQDQLIYATSEEVFDETMRHKLIERVESMIHFGEAVTV